MKAQSFAVGGSAQCFDNYFTTVRSFSRVMYFLKVVQSHMYVLTKPLTSAFISVSVCSKAAGSLRCLHSKLCFFSTPTYHIFVTSKAEETQREVTFEMEFSITNKDMFSSNSTECWVSEHQSQLSDGSTPHSGQSRWWVQALWGLWALRQCSVAQLMCLKS